MTDGQLTEKFRRLAGRYLPDDVSADLEDALWRLADLESVSELTDRYRALAVD